MPSSTRLPAFENWLGAPADGVLAFADGSTSANAITRAQDAVTDNAGHDREIFWALPLNVGSYASPGFTLAQVAAGSLDSMFASLAAIVRDARPRNHPKVARLGWEFNGQYYPWYAVGNEANYVAAFRRAVGILRSICPEIRIEWCPNWTTVVSGVTINPEPMYPGDDVVDVIGMDCYLITQFDQSSGQTAAQAWSYKLTSPYGLNWLTAFAATHSKPVSLSEWGVNVDNAGGFIDGVAAWVRANNVVHHAYWNQNNTGGNAAQFQDALSENQYPASAAAFIAQFGPISITSNDTLSAATNTAAAKALTANKVVSWSIVGGADASLFSLAGETLNLTASPNGAYVVQVRATDERGLTATQTITATVAAAVPWTPTQLGAAMVDWFDAKDTASLTKDAGTGAVSVWTSKVGSGRNLAQGAMANQPIWSATARNGSAGVAFDGSNDAMTQTAITGVPAGQAALGLAALAYGAAGLATFRYFVSIADATAVGFSLGSGSGTNPRFQDSGNVTGSGALASNDRSIVVSAPAGATATVSMSVDGNTASTGSIARNAFTPARVVLGGQAAGSNAIGNYAAVTLSEIILVNRELTSDETAKLHGYLSWANGLNGANLPVGHPYKSAAPLV